MADAAEMSKSAKQRAAKKAREERHAAEAAAAAAPPAAPKATPKPKASNGEPKAKAKAEAKPEAKSKAKAKAEPAPAPAPEAKSKAKAKAKAAAAPEPEPKAKAKAKAAAAKAEPAPKAEPKQAAKAKSEPKSKAKTKPAPPPEEPAPPKREELIQPFEMDDGAGGWEEASGLSKKQEKQAQKKAMLKAMESQAKALPGKTVPGFAPENYIPGMMKVDQAAINATLAAAAAKGKAAGAEILGQAQADKEKESNLSTVTVKVPEAKIGIVIGPKGSNIKLIQEKTGVSRIDTSGEMFTIMGPPQAVGQAEAAVKEIIEKGYCSLTFEDFKEDSVGVLPTSIPDIIGKGGVIIKAFKSELAVEVKIPEVPKTPVPGKKYKVTLAGKNENVEKAKEVINHIATYGYHPTTHPDQSHLELDVPEWAYRYLIGKAGSEMRHIQNNYKVKVNIPRDHNSPCQSVVVVGLENDCERAKTYIDKLIWSAENQTKGRESGDKAIDTWGDEEETEDWMKAYLYKR
eukprot:CAMPEP_0197658980 /NCGR_PEP_ID=MMETSP1338-20131121/45640_1 /TAXON_ID=43686 ORGANISM="Pelagodinium beii, Strain RCC1491" /NCGR_SAMPLE_ID=MMETSP1338 /ASSEMBLY_ACC=CAM_ASM_000754 /LENGTH=514 /DNA_ID=CAMNT_0043235687 /DNA_START=81 /DNA_END=1625 /DNA_ORIENTATION=+